MANNKKIQIYPETLYAEGSPVSVSKMQLCYSLDYGVNVLQITFRNLSSLTLYGLSILIETKNENGDPTEDKIVEYNYYGIEIPFNRVFGNNEDIVMESDAHEFVIHVIRAEFADGVMFHGDIELIALPAQKTLEEAEKFEKQYREAIAVKKPKLSVKYIAEKRSTYWRCSCGRVYPIDVTQCKACYVDRDWITSIYTNLIEEDKKKIEAEEERKKIEAEEIKRKKEEEAARIAAEEEKIAKKIKLQQEAERLALEEAERLAEEERLKAKEDARLAEEARIKAEEEAALRKKRRTKIAIIVLVCIAVAVGVFFGLRAIITQTEISKNVSDEVESTMLTIEDTSMIEKETTLNEETTSMEKETTEKPAIKETTTVEEKETTVITEETTVITEETTVITEETTTSDLKYFNINNNDFMSINGFSTTDLNYRSGPGLDYPIIGTLNSGETFQILGQEGEWYYINAQNTTGYANANYVNITVQLFVK